MGGLNYARRIGEWVPGAPLRVRFYTRNPVPFNRFVGTINKNDIVIQIRRFGWHQFITILAGGVILIGLNAIHKKFLWWQWWMVDATFAVAPSPLLNVKIQPSTEAPANLYEARIWA